MRTPVAGAGNMDNMNTLTKTIPDYRFRFCTDEKDRGVTTNP